MASRKEEVLAKIDHLNANTHGCHTLHDFDSNGHEIEIIKLRKGEHVIVQTPAKKSHEVVLGSPIHVHSWKKKELITRFTAGDSHEGFSVLRPK